jgi:hypothetical protein
LDNFAIYNPDADLIEQEHVLSAWRKMSKIDGTANG